MTMTPHVHGRDCPGHCSREWDVDPATTTGSWRVVTRKGYGSRPKVDRPRWWPLLLIGYKAVVQLLGILALAWVAKACGLKVTP
jgi:hypothetical protein